MKFTPLIIALTVTLLPGVASAESAAEKWLKANEQDNQSMLEYAEQNHKDLLAEGATVTINSNYSDTLAEWRYHMPDGSIISCLRGAQGYTFVYECHEY